MNKFRYLSLAIGVASLGLAATASADACNINFSQQIGLSMLSKEQAYGFEDLSPGKVGYYHQCFSTTGDWFYQDEDPYGAEGHLHIPPNNTSLVTSSWSCLASTSTYPLGVWGYRQNGVCVAFDPTLIDRYAFTHDNDTGQQIRFRDLTSSFRHWRPTSITVMPNSLPLTVVFQIADGSWWGWGGLTPGDWNLNDIPTHYATTALVRATGVGHMIFDNFGITSFN